MIYYMINSFEYDLGSGDSTKHTAPAYRPYVLEKAFTVMIKIEYPLRCHIQLLYTFIIIDPRH